MWGRGARRVTECEEGLGMMCVGPTCGLAIGEQFPCLSQALVELIAAQRTGTKPYSQCVTESVSSVTVSSNNLPPHIPALNPPFTHTHTVIAGCCN